MKIALTGHTSGLGKALYDLLSPKNEMICYSRTNGYNIERFFDVIVDKSIDCDVFINNAYSGTKQLDIFERLFKHWGKDINKTIINIGSRAKYTNYVTVSSPYAKNKKTFFDTAINYAFNHGSNNDRCRIINVNPGKIHNVENQISFMDVAKVIEFALSLPNYIEMGEIGVWSTVYKDFKNI